MDNFIKLDLNQPAQVFSREEIDFMKNLPRGFTEEDRRKLSDVEDVLYNKTTKVASFKILPGLRLLPPGRSYVYFSRFNTKSYDAMLEEFFEAPIAKLPEEDKYTAICETFRLITPNMIFYPIEFGGNIELALSLYRESAEALGAKLARFHGHDFQLEGDAGRFTFSELTVERMKSRRTPPNW